jgi:hypothetical protein
LAVGLKMAIGPLAAARSRKMQLDPPELHRIT